MQHISIFSGFSPTSYDWAACSGVLWDHIEFYQSAYRYSGPLADAWILFLISFRGEGFGDDVVGVEKIFEHFDG